MKPRVCIWDCKRVSVASLRPYLRNSLGTGGSPPCLILPEKMRPQDVPTCRWVHYGIGKGVTSPKRNMTIFGVPKEMRSGLHGEMVQGLEGIDPLPLCYEKNHDKGFDDFVRWVFFADPRGRKNFFGVDFSLDLRPTAGVAPSFRTVLEVVRIAALHGIPKNTEVALLNWRMCEFDYMTRVRHAAGLITVADWLKKGEKMFAKKSEYCPRCGQKTLDRAPARFCLMCGAQPETYYK